MTESQEQAAREAYWSWRSEQEDNLLTNSINAYLAATERMLPVIEERDAALREIRIAACSGREFTNRLQFIHARAGCAIDGLPWEPRANNERGYHIRDRTMIENDELRQRIADLERELAEARRDMTADQVRRALSAQAARCGSQKALAAAIGVSQAFICDIINGRREPSGKPVAFLGLRRVVRYERRP